MVRRNAATAAQPRTAGSTEIGDGCIFGGQLGIVGHIRIADHTTVGAKGGIIGNIRKGGETYWGIPGIPHKTFLKAYARFKKSGEEDIQ